MNARTTPPTLVALLGLAAALGGGCAEGRTPAESDFAGDRCYECHWSPTGVAVPGPPHDAHAFDCGECHPVPARVDEPGHLDDRGDGDVVFGALAGLGGAEPTWDGRSCASVYCHGPAPVVWEPPPRALSCDACHGDPPSPHLAVDDCALCHDEAPRETDVASVARHVDGEVSLLVWTGEQGQPACGACHALPPPAPHPPGRSCALCHGVAMRDGGGLDPDVHLNGRVDLGDR